MANPWSLERHCNGAARAVTPPKREDVRSHEPIPNRWLLRDSAGQEAMTQPGFPPYEDSGCRANRNRCALALAALLSVLAPSTLAASFPCEKASTRTEMAICGSSEVSELDEYLGRYHAAARSALGHAESCLVSDQRSWLRTVRDACKDTACLKRVYLERLAVLHAVQPGATSLRNTELPKVPPLVWIVPPAEDQVAAPRGRPGPPFVARGKIVNEIAQGDGIVLQSAAGAKHLIIPLMVLEERDTDALDGLARVPGARYEVRGRAAVSEGYATAFSPGHCAFVYRTAP
jgi:uncharacterized protein